MLKFLFVLPAAVLLAFLPQDSSAPAAASQTNPVTPTAESQAHAKSVYGIDCAMCHGANGNGKGDLVEDMHLTIKDMTDPDTLKSMSDGEIFAIIKNGKGKMPGESDRAKDNDIWNLVIYVRSFSRK